MKKWPIKIIHLGLGRFHRAHQAVYFQNLFKKCNEQWGIAAFSMRHPNARDQLRAVHNRYPVIELDNGRDSITWIDSVAEAYYALDDYKILMSLFACHDVTLVTLTITEKGYLLNPKGRLDQSLLKQANVNAIKLLYLGLKERKKTCMVPMTILSCDNLSHNSSQLKKAVCDYAFWNNDVETAGWINEEIAFANTMVDRIVPGFSLDTVERLEKKWGIHHSQTVVTESYTQWVIEDKWMSNKPSLELVGAQFVDDVLPYEQIKLRMLNASHSLIAYAGLIKGYQYVHQAIQDIDIQEKVLGLYKEIVPLLTLPNDVNIKEYTQSLIKRFDNPGLFHSLQQIAIDGSQKLLQRIFPSIKEAYEKNLPCQNLLGVVNDWLRYCYEFVPDDPLKEKIQLAKKKHKTFDQFENNFWKDIFDYCPY